MAIEVVTVEHFGTFLTATAVLATIVAQLGSVGAPLGLSAATKGRLLGCGLAVKSLQ